MWYLYFGHSGHSRKMKGFGGYPTVLPGLSMETSIALALRFQTPHDPLLPE